MPKVAEGWKTNYVILAREGFSNVAIAPEQLIPFLYRTFFRARRHYKELALRHIDGVVVTEVPFQCID